MERYERYEKEIGEGAYGVVYKARDTELNILVALKRILLNDGDEGIPATSLREIALLKQLKHPNVVCLYNIVPCHMRLYMVFELIDCDLKKLMDKVTLYNINLMRRPADVDTSSIPFDVFSIPNIKEYTLQIFQGLAYCHSMGVMHRDLKPQNLLVSADRKTIKIADFGLARAFTPNRRQLTVEVVTRWYRCPELLLGCDSYSTVVDVWSMGCIVAELLNKGIPLIQGSSDIDQLHKIFYHFGTPQTAGWPELLNFPYWRNNFPRWPPLAWNCIVADYNAPNTNANTGCARVIPDGVIDLLDKCFQYNPRRRITALEACNHHWLCQPVTEIFSSVRTEKQAESEVAKGDACEDVVDDVSSDDSTLVPGYGRLITDSSDVSTVVAEEDSRSSSASSSSSKTESGASGKDLTAEARSSTGARRRSLRNCSGAVKKVKYN